MYQSLSVTCWGISWLLPSFSNYGQGWCGLLCPGFYVVFNPFSLIAQLVKNPPAVQETPTSIPGLGRSPGEGKGYLLQCSGLENSMACINRSACGAGDPRLIPGLGKAPGVGMTAHSSILAWRIPGTEEPVRVARVGRDLMTKPPPPQSLFTFHKFVFNWRIITMLCWFLPYSTHESAISIHVSPLSGMSLPPHSPHLTPQGHYRVQGWASCVVQQCPTSQDRFSHVRLPATLWTAARQAPLSMGIVQARILAWVAMPSSMVVFPTKGWTWVSYVYCIGTQVLYH